MPKTTAAYKKVSSGRSRMKTPVTRSDDQGARSLASGIYSRKSTSGAVPAARLTKSSGDMTGVNNPLKLQQGLLGKKTDYATGKNKLPDNPLGISGGLFKGKGIGTGSKTPNFVNNPIGYVGGLLINKKRGG